MPNHEHYAGTSSTFPHDHRRFPGNPQSASHTAQQHQYPSDSQQRPHHPGYPVYPHYSQPVAEPFYHQSGNYGNSNQPSQMPTVPADSRYDHHSEVGQLQFPQTRHAESYSQYGYPARHLPQTNAAPYQPDVASDYPHPGFAGRQQGYMNGTYPFQPMGPHPSHTPYPLQEHSSQVPSMASRPGMHPRNAAEYRSQSQPYGGTGNSSTETETSRNSQPTAAPYQQPREAQQQHESLADHASHQLKTTSDDSSREQSKPHIVKPAVLNPDAVGKFLYFTFFV